MVKSAKRRSVFFWSCLLLAAWAGGCSSRREVHLVDGRTFRPAESHDDGRFLFFRHDGWEYTLPTMLVADAPVTNPTAIRRIVVTTNRITTGRWIFRRMDDMFVYLDTSATASNPVILELRDAGRWPPAMQEDFGTLYGTLKNRPYVGIEGQWEAAASDGRAGVGGR